MTPQDAWLFIRTHLLNEIAAGEADAREPIAVLDAHFTAGRGEKPDSVDSSDIDAMVNSSTGHAAGCPCGTCEVEGGLEICAKHCAVQKKTREEALELVLRNCLALARRQWNKYTGDVHQWAHVIRLCRDAGVVPIILHNT